ncbi:MAG TPA: 4Fe-4S dicluster domain-containing protein [Patescibacteria group bacterium]|nr:4Fe-4S dicluster domain-containing protein [Patescibacteria group bacterium]
MSQYEGEKVQNQMTKSAGTTRRGFLKITGSTCALLFGLGGMEIILPRSPLLRPPGGQDEANFISRCLRCDRCRSVCPTHVIGLANLSDSILEARTPVMKFHLGFCNFCHQCVKVCPTRALQPFDIKTVKIGVAAVKQNICIAWDSGGCMVCMNACPYHAITLDRQNRPVVDSQRCNGCGICEKVCPALVLRSYIGGKVRGIEVTPLAKRGGEAHE